MVPQTLYNMSAHIDGVSFAGDITSVTLPKMTLKTEEHRAGGMDAPVEMDQGMEKLEASFSGKGVRPEAMKFYGLADQTAFNAVFLAQVGHESGQLQYVRELGGDQYLSKYDTGPLAARLGNTPAADGDGQRYRGRGLIQITGHDNYLRCSLALFGDERLLRTPELLELPQWAAESAAWFWSINGLNTLADQGQFTTITRRINGGLNGMEDRLQLWERARGVLCVSST